MKGEELKDQGRSGRDRDRLSDRARENISRSSAQPVPDLAPSREPAAGVVASASADDSVTALTTALPGLPADAALLLGQMARGLVSGLTTGYPRDQVSDNSKVNCRRTAGRNCNAHLWTL